jgi:hypothetical protein
MRLLLVVLVCGLALAAPASASELDPRTVVLRTTDVPSGYRQEARQTGFFTNAEFSAHYAARLGRMTGFVATFRRGGGGSLRSRVDVFRRPAGARTLLRDLDDAYRSRGRRRAGVGVEGWTYSSGAWAMVVWRHERLLGAIDSWGLGEQRALALARTQQRRMAALR